MPGSISVGGFWSLSEYPEIYKLQPLFPLQYQRHITTKNDICLDSLRNEPTEEKVSSGCPHTDLKYQEEISMPPFLSVLFIYVAESISTQCSSFLPGSLDLVLGVFSLMVSTFV